MASTKNKKVSAAEFLGVADISESTLKTVNGTVFGFLIIRNSGNDTLLTEKEKIYQAKEITTALSAINYPYQIISLPRVIDTNKMISTLINLRDSTNDDVKLRLLEEEISAIDQMADNGEAKEPIRLIKVWETGKAATDKLKSKLKDIKAKLDERGVYATPATNKEILFICTVFANLCDFIDDDEEVEPLPKMKNKAIKINPKLLNVITPPLLEFKNKKIQLGSTLASAYYANKYPSNLNYAWLTKLLNCTSCVSCITFTPGNTSELGEALSKAIKNEYGEAQASHNVKDKIISNRKIDDSMKLIEDSAINNDTLGFMSVVFMPFAESDDELGKAVDKVKGIMGENKIRIKALPSAEFQKLGFKTISPYFPPQKMVLDLSQTLIRTKTLAGGFPFSNNTYKDDGGFYVGKTEDGGLIVVDFTARKDTRTNSNIVVMGKNGAGKSTLVKDLQQIGFMRGHTVISIDPEGEYKDQTENLGGVVLNAGGGAIKINPFEIREVPKDEENENGENKIFNNCSNALAFHLRTLEIFFRIYFPDISEVERVLLKQMIVEMYKNHNIDWDTDISTLKHTDYPIAVDLHNLALEKEKTDDRYKNLRALLWDMAEGSEQFLWNGHTNFDLNSQVICFDTSALQNSSDKIKAAQYFNILSFCWDIMVKRPEMVELYCDEAYLTIDEKVPETLIYLRNIAKRCRKYEGALIVISHAIIDFLAPSIRQYGQAILDMSSYRVFFGMDGINLRDATELFNFTEKEQDLLRQGKKRHALFQMGPQRVYVRFDLPQYKLDLMGTRGGR